MLHLTTYVDIIENFSAVYHIPVQKKKAVLARKKSPFMLCCCRRRYTEMIKRHEEMKTEVREHMRGGAKQVTLENIMDNGTVAHCRMFGKLTLVPGASIGKHQHIGETEYYWILQGEGIVTEADGEKHVKAGDLVITGGGATHAIRNEGTQDLVFMALIILDT
jgi:mannose-6-phosphate isomerase-like protein (cupin superfamily)